MKRTFLFYLVLFFAVCYTQAQAPLKKQSHKSGKTITVSRTTEPYRSIKCKGSFHCILTKGTNGNISLTGDENVLDLVKTEVNHGELLISFKNQIEWKRHRTKTIEIKIAVDASVGKINLDGSGNISGTEKLSFNALDLNVGGSGNIFLNLETPVLNIGLGGSGNINVEATCPKTSLHLGGSGNITFSTENATHVSVDVAGSGSVLTTGKTNDLDISIAGSGAFNGSHLEAQHVRASIAGSGSAEVYSVSTLNASIAGSGSVAYKGSPSITKNIIGSGSVYPKK